MIAPESNRSAKNVPGSAKSLPQDGRSDIGMFFEGVWIVVYAPLIERTLSVRPIFATSASSSGTIRVSTARVSAITSTPLHADAVHLPVLPGSYFDCFISAAAFATSPASFGVLYGSYSASPLLYMTGGAMWVAIEPTTGPPQALRSDCLSMT